MSGLLRRFPFHTEKKIRDGSSTVERVQEVWLYGVSDLRRMRNNKCLTPDVQILIRQ